MPAHFTPRGEFDFYCATAYDVGSIVVCHDLSGGGQPHGAARPEKYPLNLSS